MLDLNLTPEVFWDLTPHEFSILCERHNETKQQQQEFEQEQTALVCLVVARSSGNRKAKLSDFLPKRQRKHVLSLEARSPEELVKSLDMLALMTGATTNK